jgi:hypothetical protein
MSWNIKTPGDYINGPLTVAGSTTITGDLTVDTSTLVVDSTNNYVGIGTASPVQSLSISGEASLLAGNGFYWNAYYNAGFKARAAGYAAYIIEASNGDFSISNTSASAAGAGSSVSMLDRYRIDKNGIHTWEYVGGVAGTAMTLNSTGLGIGAAPEGRLNVANTATPVIFSMTLVGAQRWQQIIDTTAGNWTLRDQTGAIDALIVKAGSGNVGVGVTPSAWTTYSAIQVKNGSIANYSPTQDLRISSNAYYASGVWKRIAAAYATQYLMDGSSGTHLWYVAATGAADSTITTFSSAAMTLDASGNLLVASGVVRAAGRTQIGSGYVGDISGTGNNRGIFIGSTGILPTDGSGNPSDNTYDLGSGSNRWDTVFAGTALINTSDRNEKQDIADLSASEKRVASSIKQLVKKYRFKDAVASKGENARIHVGWIAQDIQSAFAAEGLDASKYGVFCSDTWYEVNGSSVDSDKKPYTTESENAVAKTRLGLRHDELLAFVVSNL